MASSILQTEKVCYVTGWAGKLHRHHIFGGGRRSISDRYGLWVWLSPEWHNMSGHGVHFNHDLDLRLKREAQAAFEAQHSRQAWMDLLGKNYLED